MVHHRVDFVLPNLEANFNRSEIGDYIAQLLSGPQPLGLFSLHIRLLKQRALPLAMLLLNFQEPLAQETDKSFETFNAAEFAGYMSDLLTAKNSPQEELDVIEWVDVCNQYQVNLLPYICVVLSSLLTPLLLLHVCD